MKLEDFVTKILSTWLNNNCWGSRISVRIEHEKVFAYYDLDSVEFDPLTGEVVITTSDSRSIDQVYADDSDSNTKPIRAIKANTNKYIVNNN